jgi:hypothetical protein
MTSQQPDYAGTAHVSGEASTPIAVPLPPHKPSGPTLGTRLVIFSALLLPSAVLPLLFLRRSVNGLHRKIDELKVATGCLHGEFKSVMSELSVRREEHERLRVMISETREGLVHLREETQQAQAMRRSEDKPLRDQIQELVASDR